MECNYIISEDQYLAHHGIKGQKWGVRRYQNLDGSLTTAGRMRYGVGIQNNPTLTGNKIGQSSKGAPTELVHDAKQVNGGVDIFKYGYNRNVNCAFCSASYEAKRRGLEVQAQQSITGVMIGNTLGYFKELYSNYKPEMTKMEINRKSGEMNKGMTEDEFNKMAEECIKEGANSRGQLSVQWKSRHPNGWPSGGHATNYEVKDGIFYVVDPQVGEVLSGKDAMDYLGNCSQIRRTRTDNLKMNEKLVMRKYAEKATGDYGGINKALKSAYKAHGLHESMKVITGLSVLGGGIATKVTANPAFLLIPAASLTIQGATKIGRDAFLSVARKNDRREYDKLYDKWKREGRDEWYTTETESIRKR